MQDLEIARAYGSANHYPPAVLRTACIKAAGSQSSGLFRQDSTVLDEMGAPARASNKPLYAFALLWMSYSLSFGDSDTGHNTSFNETPQKLSTFIVANYSPFVLSWVQIFVPSTPLK